MEEALKFILCHKIATLDLQYFKFWYLINLYCIVYNNKCEMKK